MKNRSEQWEEQTHATQGGESSSTWRKKEQCEEETRAITKRRLKQCEEKKWEKEKFGPR